MARVRTFMIHPVNGLPDREVTEFLNECEREYLIQVRMQLIPAVPEKNIHSRMTFVVTKLDDHPPITSLSDEERDLIR
jgi:hypothetical protein